MKWNNVNKISVGFVMHTLGILLFAVSIVSVSPTSSIFAGNDAEEGFPATQIVGGHDALEGKYPYQVSILHNYSPSCGGSIINSRFILTAAHCIYNKNLKSIKVVAGTNFYAPGRGGVTYNAESLIWHSGYNKYRNLNDIGLIQVDREIIFFSKIQPIALAETYYVAAGEIVVLTGWGRLTKNNMLLTIPSKLQEIYLSVMSQSMCESLVWEVTKNNICTNTTLSTGACFGDSGSPVVLNGVQIGIVSYGHPCALGYPDVHTRVSPYGSWITLHAINHGYLNRWSLLLLGISTLVSYSYSLS
ncbi:chymotrypsin-2-like isoform X2 [Osmia lignaria lignaria]|uniref:chymotrypsin-2-like isoform X2 n=1 Tax=Osmia lignaria lignaria TaxID=1437193 RepID=UPI00147828DC|nr:chymotrypsin-2-like isoform X2 [Osmia lignaria]